MKLPIRFHIVPNLRMCGVVHFLSPDAIMAWTGTLPLPFSTKSCRYSAAGVCVKSYKLIPRPTQQEVASGSCQIK